MQYLSIPWLLVAIASASLLVLAILWVLSRSSQNTSVRGHREDRADTQVVSFLFHDETLTNSDCTVLNLPWSDRQGISDWRDLRSWLGRRFGTLPTCLSDLDDGAVREFPARAHDDPASLVLSALCDGRRVQLFDPIPSDPAVGHYTKELETFVARFGAVLNQAPCSIRVFDKVHETAWYNKSFSSFPRDQAKLLSKDPPNAEVQKRVHLPAQHSRQEQYLELTHLDREDFQVLYVDDVTQVVHAEKARREFIQTLTKTFANLTTGLAVFNKNRRLALFNPALLDLTNLEAHFLSDQPQLTDFFDKLRDNKMLPEPRDYGSWRNQIDAMIKSASKGLYFEDWALPSGLTYRITGRPHPDGAVAFLFEDISDEVALTRRYRRQVDLRQAALDAVDFAIALTGPNNMILVCNTACSTLLDIDPDSTFSDMPVTDFIDACSRKLPHTWFWDACQKAIVSRTELDHVIACEDGIFHRCRVQNLPGTSASISVSAVEQIPVLKEDVHDIPA